MPYSDGTFTSPVQDGPKRVFYPFVNNPTKDTTTKGTVRNYVVLPGSFTPAAALSTDPDDSTQYLIEETEPQAEGGYYRFSRTYCKVPGDQVNYSSLVITKPAFPTNDYNGAYVDSTSSSATANVWSTAIAATVSRFVTGGTFTVTYKTSTTAALNYNDSDATIKAAVDALADMVSDGFTVTVTNLLSTGSITFLFSGGSTPETNLSIGIGSLTPSAIQSREEFVLRTVTFRVARSALNFNKTAHGLSAAQAIRIATGTSGAGTLTSVASVVDANNFTVTNADTTPEAFAYYRTLMRTYTPGTDRVLSRMTDKFYLPGVTSGITTGADIPVPDIAINDTQLLTLITNSATGFQTYDAEPVVAWPSEPSPMYRQRLIAINVDNL